MSIAAMISIAFALAMDAFAASMASGAIIRNNKLKKAMAFGAMFGGFQMIMPVMGWFAGLTFRARVAGIDHWVAFCLLAAIGGKMIFESFKIEKIEESRFEVTGLTLLGLSIATSIDALAVGIGFAFLEVSILLPVAVIGTVTFVMSIIGVFLGSKAGDILGRKVEALGGIILIAIGLKILFEHIVS